MEEILKKHVGLLKHDFTQFFDEQIKRTNDVFLDLMNKMPLKDKELLKSGIARRDKLEIKRQRIEGKLREFQKEIEDRFQEIDKLNT